MIIENKKLRKNSIDAADLTEKNRLDNYADLPNLISRNNGNEQQYGIVHIGATTYRLYFDENEGRQKCEDITKQLYKQPPRINVPSDIDVNKITKPVINLALQKAKDLRRQAQKNNDIEEIKKLDNYSKNLLDKPIYMVPTRTDLLLKWLGTRKLKINPIVGAELIIEAYYEYYQQGGKCQSCGKRFTQKSVGRNAKYCSNACKQKAYRNNKRNGKILKVK